jgi:anti-anti-sigma factor
VAARINLAKSARNQVRDCDSLAAAQEVVLRLRGELDLSSIGALEAAIGRHPLDGPALVVDLRELEFMDSSGLRVMLALHCRQAATRVSFLAPGEQVGRLLDVTGVRPMLRWVADPAQALADTAP